MRKSERTFHQNFDPERSGLSSLQGADWLVLIAIVVLIYIGVRLAVNAPETVGGREISLDPTRLPVYALYSVLRMLGAYLLSVVFTLIYGRVAAYNPRAEKVMMPLLDVLQSVPILSFLPVVLLGLSAVLPQNIAAELSSVVLIFTSQAWNMTFAWYQSLTTIPKELREASAIFRLNTWLRFKNLELPFGMISLIWNSMMSWAGGWFFLMAAEIFTVGQRDFRLPGIGAYLHEASVQGDLTAIGYGLGTLILVIVGLDQLVWRPLIAWSDRFKLEMVESDTPPTSWFYTLVSTSRLFRFLGDQVFSTLNERLDQWLIRRFPVERETRPPSGWQIWLGRALTAGLIALLGYGMIRAVMMLAAVDGVEWGQIGLGVLATAVRVSVALLIALAWTIPVGVLIGTNPRFAGVFQPIVQVAASVPATALFPVLLLFILQLPGGLNLAAVLLMLMGTQWYLLFNVIAGANAIPQDLKYTTALLGLKGWQRWRTLILPALFPYLITGAITASGGAWNASIVAEYVTFSGKVQQATGIGAVISHATDQGNYPLLLAGTLVMVVVVVLINRLIWRPLYRQAEEIYRME
ncbi:MAG: ABC transporter permease [Bellilinea sp.]|nr:MAG: ABC transporter permease [Bellilinea sp.]